MLGADNLELEKLKELDRQIKEKEQELLEVQSKAQQEIEGLKSIYKCECGAIISEGSKFCVNCGKKVEVKEVETVEPEQKTETALHCQYGAFIPPGAKFCVKCMRQVMSQ